MTARSEIWLAELEVEGGPPRLVNRRKIADRSDFNYLAFLEVQDFRFPEEKELLFTAYAYKGGDHGNGRGILLYDFQAAPAEP